MHTSCTFTVASFEPTDVTVSPAIETALPIGIARMEKVYEGGVTGRSATLFTSAYDPAVAQGTYVAMEAFEGTVDGRAGAFAYIHSATMAGSGRADELLRIVPASGTGDLRGIHGHGTLTIDADGTHRLALDYELT